MALFFDRGSSAFCLLLFYFLIVQQPTQGKVITSQIILDRAIISGDGVPQIGYVLNGEMPGPVLRGNVGDELHVKVINNVEGRAISFHWHGLTMMGSPWMDGASHITQCPIGYKESFEYRFKLDQAGTYLYHSHDAGQMVEGLLGALIVDDPKERELWKYEEDFVVLIQDWFRVDSETINLMKWKGYVMGLTYDSALINGRGSYNCSLYHPSSASTPFTCDVNSTNFLTTYNVDSSSTYRLRIISGASTFKFRFSIDSHSFQVITTDGHLISPITSDYVDLLAGERYDILIKTDQPPNNYWIRASVPTGEEVKGFLFIYLFI